MYEAKVKNTITERLRELFVLNVNLATIANAN